MKHNVRYSDAALSFLERLSKRNPIDAQRIFNWISKNLDGCETPHRMWKALTGDFKGAWRYRLGDYRIIAEIHDDTLTILVITIGNRKNVYD